MWFRCGGVNNGHVPDSISTLSLTEFVNYMRDYNAYILFLCRLDIVLEYMRFCVIMLFLYQKYTVSGVEPMRKLPFIAVFLFLTSPVVFADSGLVSIKSPHSVAQTLDKLEGILTSKGMTIFKRIKHSAGAKKVGIELRPTELLVFGNPKVGAPLMKCAQTVAIDLPQKALAWEDENGQVWLSYNDPAYLVKRHDIPGCDKVIMKITGALGKFAKGATSP